jgi:hypothetical protein
LHCICPLMTQSGHGTLRIENAKTEAMLAELRG